MQTPTRHPRKVQKLKAGPTLDLKSWNLEPGILKLSECETDDHVIT